MAKAKKSEEKKPTYEEMAPLHSRNLEGFEELYFAAVMKRGEHGKEGMRDGLYASLFSLREKIGLEGILGGLETQALQNIKGGEGLNGEISLSTIIANGASTFHHSLIALKSKDVLPYIRERLNGVDVAEEKDFAEKTLAELSKGNDREKAYALYLRTQANNAVMARVTPLAYQEKARRMNEEYTRQNPQPKK